MTIIGTRLVRRDARERICGEIKYTEDFTPPNVLHAVIVRSSVASGRIRHIDTSKAEQVEGVERVLTARDVPDKGYGNYLKDQPIFARHIVRYVGEPIAMIGAATLAAALQAAKSVEVDIDPLPAVVDLDLAARSDAPMVHGGTSNVVDVARITRGDVAAAFEGAHAVITTRIETHRVHQGYLEPRAVIAAPSGAGLQIIMSTQQPFGVRSVLAELFDLPISEIEIRVPAVGGGFGGKLHVGLAPHAAAMALATQRPVKLICSRTEDMQTGNPRENSIVEMTSAVERNGKFLARRCDVQLDSGAYALDIQGLNSMAAFFSTGPYNIENLEITSRGVYTNTAPTGSFRGPTGPQMVYAGEMHLDEIADAIGIGRLDIRRRNFIKRGERGPTGDLMVADVTVEQCLDVAAARLEAFRADGQRSPDGRRRGYGIACTWWCTLGTPSSAFVEVHDDGSATLSSGGTEIGTGVISTTLPAIVAEVLGVDAGRVTLNNGSTRDAPFESGSRGSRTLFCTGNAALLAAQEAAKQIKDEAAEMLGLEPEDLVLRDGRVEANGTSNASLPLAEVVMSAKMRSGPVLASGRYRAKQSALQGSTLDNVRFARLGEATFHCHAVEIALDEETGRIEVLRYAAVHDVGRILNPVAARGQVEGGIVQGIGYALTENLERGTNGAVRNGNFHDYRMPTIADVPAEIETIFIETNEGATGPFGAKGVGEPPIILPAAAIGSAIRDLLGRQPARLPFDAAFMAGFLIDDRSAERE